MGTWVDGSSSWRSDRVDSTPKITMAMVTMPTISRLARLSLVSWVMTCSFLSDPGLPLGVKGSAPCRAQSPQN